MHTCASNIQHAKRYLIARHKFVQIFTWPKQSDKSRFNYMHIKVCKHATTHKSINGTSETSFSQRLPKAA